MIVDIHVHTGPRLDAAARRRLRNDLQAGGVGMALISSVGLLEFYPEPAKVRRYNDDAALFAHECRDAAHWLAYLNPQNRDWQDELERCVDAGAIGIKLWSALLDKKGQLDNAHAVVAEAGRRGLPVLIHTWGKTVADSPGEIGVERLAELALAAPDATLIGAHAGGNWRHTIGVLGDAPNACVDCSGYFPERGLVKALAGDLGPERVLFGSDMPGRSLASQLAKVALADMPDADKALILRGNAERIFGLDLPTESGPAVPPVAEERPVDVLPDRTVEHFCFCGRWPFFPTPCQTPAELSDVLRGQGIGTAYVADLGSVFRQDLAAANAAFVAACDGLKRVEPLAVVNPRATNWRAVLAAGADCAAGIWLSPYLHNWPLNGPEHAALLDECARLGAPVWINCAFGDQRTRHSAMEFRPVSTDELAGFLDAAPGNDYVLQGVGWGHLQKVAAALTERGDVRAEISRLTDLYGHLNAAVEAGLLPYLVMGSEFPLRRIEEVWWAARRCR
jgi:predicted TIM-barrel fold metal-dependent hydrolase